MSGDVYIVHSAPLKKACILEIGIDFEWLLLHVRVPSEQLIYFGLFVTYCMHIYMVKENQQIPKNIIYFIVEPKKLWMLRSIHSGLDISPCLFPLISFAHTFCPYIEEKRRLLALFLSLLVKLLLLLQDLLLASLCCIFVFCSLTSDYVHHSTSLTFQIHFASVLLVLCPS